MKSSTSYDHMIRLGDRPGGAARSIVTEMRRGRFQVSTVGADPNLQLVGSDPWGSASFTGLQVPAVPTPAGSPQLRYLFMMCRARFHNGSRVRLVGFKQYAELLATLQLGDVGNGSALLTQQITSPLWRFPDGNISWHIVRVGPGFRDTRNPANADSLIYLDSRAPALLFQNLGPYVPPNGGRPWGKPMTANDLGNLHDLRYPWRDSQSELELNVPIATPCDVVCYASVAQHNVDVTLPDLTAAAVASLPPETQFWYNFQNSCMYGRIAASMIFEEETQP